MKILVTGGSGFIGTNLIGELCKEGHDIINIDIAEPKIAEQGRYWVNLDILDREKLTRLFMEQLPTHIVHLAARTDTDGTKLEDYEVNTRGTENILAAIKETESIQRVIITSTQFVNQYNGIPKDDLDFSPHTIYGETKVLNEIATRNSELDCIWTIIRPTNIWGPWHLRYPHEFWRVMGKGLYFHPGNEVVIRSYGYVKNVVYQIMEILGASPNKVSGKVYYVGDQPIELLDWVNGFSIMQTGKKVRIVPSILVKVLALLGDVLSTVHVKFPITSSRYNSMTTSNGVPMDKAFDAFGIPPYTLDEGISDTVDWLIVNYPELVSDQHTLTTEK